MTSHGPHPAPSAGLRAEPFSATGRLYLDHAATSPLRPEAAEILLRLSTEALNPNSVHGSGQRARRLLEDARARVASVLGLPAEQVRFVSGASEANNLALRGAAEALAKGHARLRLFSSPLEHSCVRATAEALAAANRVKPQPLAVTAEGRATVPVTEAGPDGLLALMAVQNETGVVQDLDAGRDWASRGGLWLCDAAQGLGRLDLRGLGASLVVISSHKVGGPAGVGVLAGPLVAVLAPQVTGGPQEGGLRAGTQAVALACAFAEAAVLADEERPARNAALAAWEREVLAALDAAGVRYWANGSPGLRVPGILSISIQGLDGADAVVALALRGIDVSSGAACATGVMEASPALQAMFPADEARARGAIRISASAKNSLDDARRLAATLAEIAGGPAPGPNPRGIR